MPMAPRPNSMGLPASSNITSYWSNRRACDPPSASSALAAASPDTEPDSPVEADSSLVAPRRIQTGQNSLSAVAKNLVPQTGQVRASCRADPNSRPGCCMGSPGSGFTHSTLLQRRLAHRRVLGKQSGLGLPRKPSPPPSAWCDIYPQHLPLSCRSLSSRTRLYRRILADHESFSLFSSLSDTPALEIDL